MSSEDQRLDGTANVGFVENEKARRRRLGRIWV